MNNKELAQNIIALVGGKTNIIQVTHCVTRLRFSLKDEKLVQTKTLQALDKVMGAQYQGGQYQVIIGSGVNKVYAEVASQLNLTIDKTQLENIAPKKKGINAVIETLSAILIPSLPPVIGGGMIKGFLFMFWQFGMLEWGSPLFDVLNLISDTMFFFYPFLLAVSAAKRFKVNEYMALSLAGALLYPTIVNGLAEGVQGITLGFINIPFVDYSASVIPIILSVWLLSYVYNFFEKHIPDILSVIFTPMLTLLIVIPLQLVVLAPLGFYCGEYLAMGIKYLIDLSPIISGFVIGAFRPLMVLTGMHHAIRPIVQQQISTYGGSTIGAINYMSTMAQAAAALGVYFVTKNRKMKNLSLSATISGFLGVTEPSLYSVIVKYKVAMIATVIGGGIGGAIASHFGAAEYAMVMSSLLTIPATMGEGFTGIVIGLPVSIIVTLAIILICKKSIQAQDSAEALDSNEEEENIATVSTALDGKVIELASPGVGTLADIKKVNDTVFADEVIGKGVALMIEDGNVYAPIDGEVTMLFPTKHAVGILSTTGVEILLHIGIDTVNLEGKWFESFVQKGDSVKKGQKIMNFNKKEIEAAGYDTTTIMVVTNSQSYLDIFPVEDTKKIGLSDTVLKVVY